MLQKIRQYLIALTVVLAMAVAYQTLVTPQLHPPEVKEMHVATMPPLTRFNESIKGLFPDEDCWQRGGCTILKTVDGMLLFEEWVDLGNNKFRLSPLSIVVGGGLKNGGSTAPITIDAPQGAEIQFNRSLQMGRGPTPAIERGRVIGPVVVKRLVDDSENNDLLVHTSNIGLDSQKIWTTDEFDLTSGGLSMRGRDLTLHLTKTGKGIPELERVELIYLYGLKYSVDETKWMDFVCDGRVEYQFSRRTLEMRDAVSLAYRDADQLTTFFCDSLECVLADPEVLSESSNAGASVTDQFEKIIAVGQPVVLKSGAMAGDFSANKIEVISGSGGRLGVSATGPSGVTVNSADWGGTFKELQCNIQMGDEPRLLQLLVDGFGRAFFRDDSGTVGDMSWQKSFKLSEAAVVSNSSLASTAGVTAAKGAQQSQIQVAGKSAAPRKFDFVISGDVKGRFDLSSASTEDRKTSGQFGARTLTGAVKLIANAPQPVSLDAQDGKQQKTTCLPEWISLQDDVRISTDSVDAETDELLLFFEQSQFLSNAKQSRPATAPRSTAVVAPSAVEPVVKKSHERQIIMGRRISAKLAVANDDRWAPQKVNVEGQVSIRYMHQHEGASLPAKLTGGALQYEGQLGSDVVQLRGTPQEPARLEVGDGFFVGPMIQLRPSQNVLWMNSAGEFQLPSVMMQGTADATDPNAMRWVNAPHCRWQGELLFDGNTVVLSEGIDITASVLSGGDAMDVQLRGDRMQVDLAGKVEMMKPSQMQGVEIQRITITETEKRPVEIQVLRLAAGEKSQSKHLLYTQKLEFTPSEMGGVIKGFGPGWYRGWLPAEDAPLPYTGVHLLFKDAMQVSVETKTLDFLGGVRVGKRAVAGFEPPFFDASTMDSISVGDSTLDCERIRVNADPAGTVAGAYGRNTSPWELEAVDGVVFRDMGAENGLLVGTASRVTYSNSKDLFKIDGTPNRPAFFELTNADGTPRAKGTVRTMTVRVSTKEVENMILESLDIATPQNRDVR
ncbi:MAG: hypothetical protein CBD74_05410 [Saprospirales bacterium TMED214]|nr:MAG: hypothetical protein CBD74_05410 [Saprospirales bacterium TMED214]